MIWTMVRNMLIMIKNDVKHDLDHNDYNCHGNHYVDDNHDPEEYNLDYKYNVY